MKAPNNILNNIMNRDTYITGKCCLLLNDILEKDFNKINHNTSQHRIDSFMSNLQEAIDKKIHLHLSLNNMLDLILIDLNSSQTIEDNNYFFYKIDGLDNFSRGINNYSIFTGIVINKKLFCYTCFIPQNQLMVWYQEEEPMVYCNNVVKWSKYMTRRAHRSVKLTALSIHNYKNFLFDDANKYFISNNFTYDFYLLMNDSIGQWVVEDITPGQQFLLNQWKSLEIIDIVDQNNYKIITKKYQESP